MRPACLDKVRLVTRRVFRKAKFSGFGEALGPLTKRIKYLINFMSWGIYRWYDAWIPGIGRETSGCVIENWIVVFSWIVKGLCEAVNVKINSTAI